MRYNIFKLTILIFLTFNKINAQEPIGCIESAFMFQNEDTDVYILNLADGNMIQIKDNVAPYNINSIGFNKKDGYFWGYKHTNSDGSVAKDGVVVRIGYDNNDSREWSYEEFTISELNGFDSVTGDVDDNGYLYLQDGDNNNRIAVVDLNENPPKYLKDITLTKSISLTDWAFNPKDKFIYAVNYSKEGDAKHLYQINISDGNVVDKGDIGAINETAYNSFGAGFFDADGFFYIYHNKTGDIYRIDVAKSSEAVWFAKGPEVIKNDGAMCTDAKFKFDFGDAPERYPTNLEQNGARHLLPTYQQPSIYLGENISEEFNGNASEDADGDKYDDGVTIDGETLQGKTIDAGSKIKLNIKSVGEGYLNAWIDLNADGDFNDTGEQIAKNIFSSGSVDIEAIIPSSHKDVVTYARFRYSSQQDLTPDGVALDGEVEDYQITIERDLEPFVCEDRLYLTNRSESGYSLDDSGATWLHQFQAYKPSLETIGGGFSSSDSGYNAIAYNIKDNFIYAIYGNELIVIDKVGSIKNLGVIEGLPDTQLYAGSFDRDGYYYISGDGGYSDKMYKIDIDSKKVIDTISFRYSSDGDTQPIKFSDMAIDSSGKYFYAMLLKEENGSLVNDKFVKIDKDSGLINVIGDNYTAISYIGLIYIDNNDQIILAPDDGELFHLDLNTTRAYIIRQDFKAINRVNDGTNCPDANFTMPPHIPVLSIKNLTQKAEGDEGETLFEFELSLDENLPTETSASFYYKVIDGDGNLVTPPHEIATSADNDFKAENNGVAVDMAKAFGDGKSYKIVVPIYGDTKVEKDEEFYVDIYLPDDFPQNYCILGRNRGIGLIINDDINFKVIRIDGDLDNSNLYTQVSNRDFDYSIISYNEGKLENIDSITVKLDLIDNITKNTIHTSYIYIDGVPKEDILDSKDLAIPLATRNASFNVTFLRELNGTIAHGNYASKEEFDKLVSSGYSQVKRDASDEFSIRPAGLYILIGENNGSIVYRHNKTELDNYLNLASGHDYYIEAKSIDKYGVPIKGYTTSSGDVDTKLIFGGNANCADRANVPKDYSFKDGTLQNTLSHINVGEYKLHLEDTTWSKIDKENEDCIVDSYEIPEDKNAKVGCNIVSDAIYPDMKIKFNPYRFKMASYVENIPATSRNYVYMNNLRTSLDMGIALDTKIKAEDEKGNLLTNFTSSCYADDLKVKLNFNLSTDKNNSSNIDLPIETIKGSELTFQRVISYNGTPFDVANVEDTNLSSQVTITSDKFLDSNEGNSSVKLMFNVTRKYNEPTNPIEITFKGCDLNSSLVSKLEDKDFYSSGQSNIDVSKLLYYATIAPDRENYEDVFERSIKTPIDALIYCKYSIDWCSQKIGSNGLNNEKTMYGWYRAVEHNSEIDGKVINFTVSNQDANVKPNSSNLPNFNEGFRGRIDNIVTEYGGKILPAGVIVDINITEWLKYHKEPSRKGIPFWKIMFTEKDATWSGVGTTGNHLQIKTSTKPTKKISW